MRPAFSQGKCVQDPQVLQSLASIPLQPVNNEPVSFDFCTLYRDWIISSQLVELTGIEQFTDLAFSQGCTEAFDKWYVRHSKRRFRIWRGEYAYHRHMFESGLRWQWLDDEPLAPDDCVIISCPFADSGGMYRYRETLEQCEDLGCPTLVDLCWFGTTHAMQIDVSYSCIEQLTFSLSKTFPVSRHRIGLRMSRNLNAPDGLHAYAKDCYLNYHSQRIGEHLIKTFSPDYIALTYGPSQKLICEKLHITPSHSVLLATGGARWKHLNRGGIYNRLCLSDELVNLEI